MKPIALKEPAMNLIRSLLLNACVAASLTALAGAAYAQGKSAPAAAPAGPSGPTGPLGPVGLTLKTILQADTTMIGQPIRFPQSDGQITAVLAEVAPGGQVGRHLHPVPLLVYILEGELTIDMEQHGTHKFRAGEGLAEIINSWHNGRNLGDKPVRFLIVFAGQKGTPNLIRP
jgi:quercetin dioxygenase-like cupin family protein